MNDRYNFKILQVGRGIAATMVVICHVGRFVGAEPDLWQRHAIDSWTFVGAYGVDFFFILSGIVILLAHSADIGKASKMPTYFWKRFRRIYPIYWLLLLPLLIKGFLTHSEKTHSSRVIASNLTLFHIGSLETIMGPSWTLFHEVLFYILFSALLYRKQFGVTVLTLWLTGSIFFFNHASVAIVPFRYSAFAFSPLHLLFGLGLVIGWAIRNKHTTRNLWFCAVGLAGFITSMGWTIAAHKVEILWIRMAGDLALAICIWAVMGRELALGLKVPKFFTLLGDASYSIYLSHFMVVSLIARTLYANDSKWHTPISVVMACSFTAAIMAGLCIHVWLEMPLLRLLSTRHRPQMSAA